MKKTTIVETIIALIVIAIISVFFVNQIHKVIEPKLGINGYSYYGVARNTGVLCGSASSTLVVATSTGARQYIRFSNTSASTIYLALGQNATVSSGITVFASSTFEFTQNPIIYMGSVYCFSPAGTATVTVEELN